MRLALLPLSFLATASLSSAQTDVPAIPLTFDVTAYGAVVDDGLDDRAAIQNAILAAQLIPGSTVYFPPGNYHIGVGASPNPTTPALLLAGIQGMTLRGPGAVLRFTDRERTGIILDAIEDVTFEGLTLRYDGPCNFTARMVSYAFNPPARPTYTIRFPGAETSDQFLTGATGTPTRTWRIRAFDPVTLRPKYDSSQFTCDGFQVVPNTSGHEVELTPALYTWTPQQVHDATNSTLLNIAPNDLLVVSVAGGLAPWLLHSTGSTNLTFQDVTMTNSSFLTAQHDMDSNVTYNNCHLEPRASELLAINLDGLRFLNNQEGPTITNCTFNRLGDDAINIFSFYIEVQQVSGSTITIHESPDGYDTSLQSGDRCAVVDGVTLMRKGELTVTSIQEDWPTPGVAKATVSISMSPGSALMPGDSLYAANHSRGMVIRDNVIRNTFARGIFVKGQGGTIEGNTISGTTLGGIAVSPDLRYFTEMGFTEDVIVRNNTVHNGGGKHWFDSPNTTDLGGITIGFTPKMSQQWGGIGHGGVTVDGNWISGSRFAGLFIGAIEDRERLGSKITNNTILSSHLRAPRSPNSWPGSALGILSTGFTGCIALKNTRESLSTTPGNTIDLGSRGVSRLSSASMDNAGSWTVQGTTAVLSTSFEQEEPWGIPGLTPSDLPSFPQRYLFAPNTTVSLHGMNVTFDNWSLYGNALPSTELNRVRGAISARTNTAGARISITDDQVNHAPFSRVAFWLLKEGAGGDVQLEYANSAGTVLGTSTIAAASIPAGNFGQFGPFVLPSNTTRVTFRLPQASEYVYLDDVVLYD